MRHLRFRVDALHLDRDEVPIRYGDLLVTRTTSSAAVDWECVLMTVDPAPIDHGAHHLRLVTTEQRELAGHAILVRSIEGTHVFRGAGPIHGFDPAELG